MSTRKNGTPLAFADILMVSSRIYKFMEVLMELKNKVWMTGSLEWFTYIGDKEVFLRSREVLYPFSEGDKWINRLGDVFQVIDGEIHLLERVEPPKTHW